MTAQTFDHPFFARMWTVMSAHEAGAMKKLRKENLAGLSGRVLEVGAGTGTNFEFYPETVSEVVALEPETRLAPHAKRAAASAPVPVTVIESTIETMPATEPFDAVANGQHVVEHPEDGEVVWRDDEAVTCRRWNWRQGRRTALSDDTRTAFFILDALAPVTDAELFAAADALAQALSALGPEVRVSRRLVAAP